MSTGGRMSYLLINPEEIMEAIDSLTDQERERLFEELIPSKFCRWCGYKHLPCYCRRDD